MDGDRAPAGDEPDYQFSTHRRQVIASLCNAVSEIPNSPDAALTVLARAARAGFPLNEQCGPGGGLVEHAAGLERSALPGVVEDPRPEPAAAHPPKTPAQRGFATAAHSGTPTGSVTGCAGSSRSGFGASISTRSVSGVSTPTSTSPRYRRACTWNDAPSWHENLPRVFLEQDEQPGTPCRQSEYRLRRRGGLRSLHRAPQPLGGPRAVRASAAPRPSSAGAGCRPRRAYSARPPVAARGWLCLEHRRGQRTRGRLNAQSG
jgi:hypothetical protein